MCVNGELLSTLDVMNARWDYRSRRLMSVMRMVDGSGRSMKMVDGVRSMVEMVIFCHGFSVCRVLFFFWNF